MHNTEAAVATIQFAHCQEEFEKLVLFVETDAPELDRIAQRMFIVFKTDATNETIARRFPEGSPERTSYLREQEERRTQFYGAMDRRSQRCREVYSGEELLAYARARLHGTVKISKHEALSTFENWKAALGKYPENYQARITADLVPIKYSTGNGAAMIHQGVQIPTEGRLKGFLVTGSSAVKHFSDDFKLVWERAAERTPDNSATVRWIDEQLIPALLSAPE